MAGVMQAAVVLEAPWREPVETLMRLADDPWAVGFVSGGADACWSYVAAAPDRTLNIGEEDPGDPFARLAELAGPFAPNLPYGPPFQGGVAGLASYDLGDRVERLGLARLDGWPDLACARYPAVLAFDHRGRRVLAVGRGATTARAQAQAQAQAHQGNRAARPLRRRGPGARRGAVGLGEGPRRAEGPGHEGDR
jgi:para-aminobenzoate synthetase component 1